MAVNTSASLFTSGSVSDPQSPLVAGVISYNGLIPILGTTGTNGRFRNRNRSYKRQQVIMNG
jgi:hypothetical protein